MSIELALNEAGWDREGCSGRRRRQRRDGSGGEHN
jgi:hypothetical protein